MSSLILAFTTDPQLDADLSPIGTYAVDGAEKLCYLAAREFPDGQVLAHFADDGSQIIQPHAVVAQMAKLGNIDGFATSGIQLIRYQGHEQQALGDPQATDTLDRLYPADSIPFDIEVRHKEFLGNANPEWDGWGWRAEMIGSSSVRDPSARAIAIYSDAACTAYLYTTGAFVEQQSEWQVDSEGLPLTVWATEYNPGLLGYDNDEKQDVHHAILLGAAQEGHQTLLAGQDYARHLFFDFDYVEPGSGGTWTDTGVTVIQLAGQVYRMSAVVSDLAIGETIRLGDSETAFAGYWPTVGTPSDYIQITPYVSVPVGTSLWRLL